MKNELIITFQTHYFYLKRVKMQSRPTEKHRDVNGVML